MSDAAKVRLTDSRDAFKSDLIEFDVRGGFTEEVASQLQTDTKLVSEIIWKLLDVHFTDRLLKPILDSAGIELTSQGIIRKKRDSNFRANVLNAYEYRCAVCGFDVRLGQSPVALEAAHIKWHRAEGPDVVVNGWLSVPFTMNYSTAALLPSPTISISWYPKTPRVPRAYMNGSCASMARSSTFHNGRSTTPTRISPVGTSRKSSKVSILNVDPA